MKGLVSKLRKDKIEKSEALIALKKRIAESNKNFRDNGKSLITHKQFNNLKEEEEILVLEIQSLEDQIKLAESHQNVHSKN